MNSCSTPRPDDPSAGTGLTSWFAVKSISETGLSRYEALDGMRGLCAVIVALMHCDFALGSGVFFWHGWLSVDMFFVLSGFVLAMKYEDRLQSAGGLQAFMVARATRLLPVQFLGTVAVAASFLILYLTGHLDFPAVTLASIGIACLCGLFLIPMNGSPIGNLFPNLSRAFPVNAPLWSLQAEWIVNLVYARWLHAVRTRFLAGLWSVLAICLAIHVILGKQTWDHTIAPADMIAGLGRAMVGFPGGVLVYRAHRRGLLTKLPSVNPRAVFGLWLIICMLPLRHVPLLESMVAILVAPLCIALLIRAERQLPKLYAVLGTLSYPLYASHFAIVNLAKIWFVEPSGRNLPYVFVMLAIALLLASGIHRLAGAIQTRALRKSYPPAKAVFMGSFSGK